MRQESTSPSYGQQSKVNKIHIPDRTMHILKLAAQRCTAQAANNRSTSKIQKFGDHDMKYKRWWYIRVGGPTKPVPIVQSSVHNSATQINKGTRASVKTFHQCKYSTGISNLSASSPRPFWNCASALSSMLLRPKYMVNLNLTSLLL
jgi:hypothetical protein